MTYDHVTLSVELDTGNDAVIANPCEEVARMLRAVADRIEHCGNGCASGNLRDLNGNTVGTFNLYSKISGE